MLVRIIQVKRILSILFVIVSIGCGIPKEKYAALEYENARLRTQVDTLSAALNDIRFGASALLKKARLQISSNDYESAKSLLSLIIEKYYSSKESLIAKSLIKEIDPKIEEIVFRNAQNEPGLTALENYLSIYPTGAYVDQARFALEERYWHSILVNSSLTNLDSFINRFPYSIHIDEARELAIQLQVSNVFDKGNYNSLPPFRKNYSSYTEEASVLSRISIENSTGYTLTVLYSGVENRKLEISKYQTESISLKSGSYKIVAFVDAPNVNSCAGVEILDGEYSARYFISTNSGSTYRSNRYDNSVSESSRESYSWENYNNSSGYRPSAGTSVYKTRIGAICCDGTRSHATGRGACSHHGGVCEWLYE